MTAYMYSYVSPFGILFVRSLGRIMKNFAPENQARKSGVSASILPTGGRLEAVKEPMVTQVFNELCNKQLSPISYGSREQYELLLGDWQVSQRDAQRHVFVGPFVSTSTTQPLNNLERRLYRTGSVPTIQIGSNLRARQRS